MSPLMENCPPPPGHNSSVNNVPLQGKIVCHQLTLKNFIALDIIYCVPYDQVVSICMGNITTSDFKKNIAFSEGPMGATTKSTKQQKESTGSEKKSNNQRL